MGRCNKNNIQKLQSLHIFGDFDIEIAAEAQEAYFYQTLLHALLKGGSEILGTAYKERMFASLLMRRDCDSVMLCLNKDV